MSIGIKARRADTRPASAIIRPYGADTPKRDVPPLAGFTTILRALLSGGSRRRQLPAGPPGLSCDGRIRRRQPCVFRIGV
jgi:hypothetical protein